MNLTEYHDVDAEELLVAAAFHAGAAERKAIVSSVRVDQFHSETCRIAWRALLDLLAFDVDVSDREAVFIHIGREGAWREVGAVTTRTVIVSNWGVYLKAVIRGAEVRQLTTAANQINAKLRAMIDDSDDYEETPGTIAAEGATALHAMLTGGTQTTSLSTRQVMRLILDRLQERSRRKNAGELITARTGVAALDAVMPFREDSIFTLVAPSGTGKSSLMAQVGLFTAASGGGVTLFTHEMSAEDMGTRVLSQMESIHEGNLEDGVIVDSDWAAINRGGMLIRDLPLRIDACPATMDDLEHGIRYAHAVHGHTWFLIDYAQLLNVSGVHAKKDKSGQMSHVGQRLLALRRELKCGILLLAQTIDPKSWGDGVPTINHCAYGRGLKEPSSAMGIMYEKDGFIYFDLGKNRKGASDETSVPFKAGRLSDPTSTTLDDELKRRRDLLAVYEHTQPEGKPEPDASALLVGKLLCAIADDNAEFTLEDVQAAAKLLGVE